MKRSLIILASLFVLSGCAPQQPEIEIPELPEAPAGFVAAGEVIDFGEPVRIGVGDVREPLAEFTVMGVDVIEGSESFWQKLQNADDFAGQTPYFVIIQYRQDAGDDLGPYPQFFPVLADGTAAVVESGFGSAMAGDLPCGLDLPMGGEGVTVKCYVGVGTPDAPVVGAQWFNSHSAEAYVDDSATSNPYFESPVEFRK